MARDVGRSSEKEILKPQKALFLFAHRHLLSVSVWVLPVTAYHTDGEKSSAPVSAYKSIYTEYLA